MYNGYTVEDTPLNTLKGSKLIAYTDYPIPELVDKFYTKAPMRECCVLSYDGENYCEVIVEGRYETLSVSIVFVSFLQDMSSGKASLHGVL